MEPTNAKPSERPPSSVGAMLGTAVVLALCTLLGLAPLALMVIGAYTVVRWLLG